LPRSAQIQQNKHAIQDPGIFVQQHESRKFTREKERKALSMLASRHQSDVQKEEESVCSYQKRHQGGSDEANPGEKQPDKHTQGKHRKQKKKKVCRGDPRTSLYAPASSSCGTYNDSQ
jgi:hypothetical protein